MPAKRKAGGGKASSSAAATPAPNKRQSKLAKENNITAQEESEIKEAFSLFAEPMEGVKEGVIPIEDVRRAMIALGIPPKDKAELADFVSILDPDDEGFAEYSSFVAICALKMHAQHRTSDAHAQEVDEAFALFTGAGARQLLQRQQQQQGQDSSLQEGNNNNSLASGGGGDEEANSIITLAHLRRVAAMLREDDDDVDDELLRDMILEANGGAGVSKGVRRDEFEAILRRAGVWR